MVNDNDTITLPRNVVEQALEALRDAQVLMDRFQDEKLRRSAMEALRAALEQPQGEQEPGVLMPSRSLVDQVIQELARYCNTGEMDDAESLLASLQFSLDPDQQPPTTEQSSAVQQPQGEQEPFAWISPRALEWGTRQSEKVVKLTCKAQPEYDFTEPLYTHPQNLRCKSNQARLATLWGYVKADQPPVVEQPQVEQEPVAWLHADGKHQPLYTHPQPKREPLTEDEIFSAIRPLCNSDTNCKAIIGISMDEYRAIESAHCIECKK